MVAQIFGRTEAAGNHEGRKVCGLELGQRRDLTARDASGLGEYVTRRIAALCRLALCVVYRVELSLVGRKARDAGACACEVHERSDRLGDLGSVVDAASREHHCDLCARCGCRKRASASKAHGAGTESADAHHRLCVRADVL